MIYAEGLTKIFDDFIAVNQVSFSVAEGRVLALLGKNGAGKTTTIRMLSSILKPTSGSAKVAGYDIVLEAQKVRASVGGADRASWLVFADDPLGIPGVFWQSVWYECAGSTSAGKTFAGRV